MLAQAAHSIQEIPDETFDTRCPAPLPKKLLRSGDAAEFPPRGSPRVGLGQPCPAELLLLHREMSGDLVVQVAVQAARPENRQQSVHSGFSRKRRIIATVRLQSSDSRSTCFRPKSVSW